MGVFLSARPARARSMVRLSVCASRAKASQRQESVIWRRVVELLSGGGRGSQKDQALYGSVIAPVVSDDGNIQLYGCGCDPGIRK
jgi:hypothetical protein